MDIQTVLEKEDVYLVNGAIAVPKVPGNRDYQAILEWIAQGNISEQYAPPVTYKTQFSSREFLKRLGPEKQAALKFHTDIMAQLWYDQILAADFIDVKDEDTVMAANYGISIGVFTEQEVQQLLAPEIIESET